MSIIRGNSKDFAPFLEVKSAKSAVNSEKIPLPKSRTLTFRAHGRPAPQGSKRHVGNGVMLEMSKKVKPWRETVKYACIDAMGTAGNGISGPITIDITFTVAKPKSAPKRSRTYPDRKPDLDKLLRSTFDALSEAGAYEDDARVIECRARKVFPGEHPDALAVPGAVISIRSAIEVTA